MTTTISQEAAPATMAGPGLAVILRPEAGGQVLASESVTFDDLIDVSYEVWREACLRTGRLEVGLDDLGLRVVPVLSQSGADRLAGFALEGELPGGGGPIGRHGFTIYSVEAVARRASNRLVQAGILKEGEQFYYQLDTLPAPVVTEAPGTADLDDDFEVTFKNPPLHFLSVPIGTLLHEARIEGEHRQGTFPVFLTEDARAMAETFARKGAVDNPRFESGAVLVGSLCSCPETGEFFVVITDVFEVTDADSSLVTLGFSGKSWARIETVVKARQRTEPAIRILGQAHGHNFLPNNGKLCEECPKLAECSTNNLYASNDDLTWTKAVFARQPWGICQIFGLTARGDKVQGLFTQHDGRLIERRYFIIPGFDAGNHPVRTVEQ